MWEAKQRKKKRFVETIKKARAQSEQIFDNDSFTPLAKARQVREIYRQAMKKSKPKSKEIIIGRLLTASQEVFDRGSQQKEWSEV